MSNEDILGHNMFTMEVETDDWMSIEPNPHNEKAETSSNGPALKSCKRKCPIQLYDEFTKLIENAPSATSILESFFDMVTSHAMNPPAKTAQV